MSAFVMVDGHEGAPESAELIDHDRTPQGGKSSRWGLRLAVVAGAAGCAALAATQVGRSPAAVSMDNLRKPFRLYDTSAPGCKPMPTRADQYDGIADERPVTIKDKDGVANVFVVGDWGATLPAHITFASQSSPGDANAQINVANAMKNRAAWADPQYVLNVGDNFYVEGLQHSCNAPPNDNPGLTSSAFSQAWQSIYGPLATKPWLSVLGNHDYGGWRMDKGWPQQIGYSFMNYNWIMPARYYSKRMTHSNFAVDYFMIDSNSYDAKPPGDNPDHNICSNHNYGGVGTCANNGGMPNVGACRDWFWGSWSAQKAWLEKQLQASDADWKVVVTHFPCGYDSSWYKGLKKNFGLDLIATGHRHQQELWRPGTPSKYVQGFMRANGWDGANPACFVTGGGGGIVSQKFAYADYGVDLLWYGFFHLTISKHQMNIELVNSADGKVAGNWTIFPHGSAGAHSQAQETLRNDGICASFCGDSNNPWSKVCGWMSCASCEGCQ